MKKILLDRIAHLTQHELYNELYRDPLTGCLNRRAFELEFTPPELHFLFIAIVDLDSLKWINDNLGHDEGNASLKCLAGELRLAFGQDSVYRLGGDEFAVTANHVVELRDALTSLQDQAGSQFTYGLGINLPSADIHLRSNKLGREAQGLRAPRGERPPWIPVVDETA